ncbi:MAG: hypothetical protein ACRDSM_14100, partial [Pseudonocardiaceae bacterium]
RGPPRRALMVTDHPLLIGASYARGQRAVSLLCRRQPEHERYRVPPPSSFCGVSVPQHRR